MINDNIKYRGSVNIKKRQKKRVLQECNYHNQGTELLFEIICRSLVGNNMSSSMPTYLDIETVDDNGEYSKINLIRIHYSTAIATNSTNTSGNGWKAVFTFIIPGNYIENNKTIDKVKLYNSTSTNADPLAIIDLTNEETKIITDNSSNLLITWTMEVNNE